MNIIFITLGAINDISDRNLYADLVRYLLKNGHNVTVVSPVERRSKMSTNIKKEKNFQLLRVKTLNIQKTNFLEKTFATFLIDGQIKKTIQKKCTDINFDLAIYSTPPITLVNTIHYIKTKYSLQTYLLLKDIFPQNAVDLGFFSTNSWIYKFFRKKESRLYELSDHIGCMSVANINYLSKHNMIDSQKIHLCPNSIEIQPQLGLPISKAIRQELGVLEDAVFFIYGGNLGKPQGIDFLIEILKANISNEKVFFLIVGAGTEFLKIRKWFDTMNPINARLMTLLHKEKFDQFVAAADVGLIFLDFRFTIPNYPSRLLSYMANKKPILAFTDPVSDIGKNAETRGYGKWGLANNIDNANKKINFFTNCSRQKISDMGNIGYEYLCNNYSVENTYSAIFEHLDDY